MNQFATVAATGIITFSHTPRSSKRLKRLDPGSLSRIPFMRLHLARRRTVNSDHANIQFLEPGELNSRGRQGYLKSLLEDGARSMAENAIAEVRVIAVGEAVLPVLIVEPALENCDLCSPMAHHVHYARDEVVARAHKALKWFFRLAYAAFGKVLDLGRIDRVVYVNNWLFSTNPCLELSTAELIAVRRFLQQQYPGHAQVFRSVHPALFPDQETRFMESGYTLIKSRDVFVWPSEDTTYLERKNYHRDRKLLESSDARVIGATQAGPTQVGRLQDFYRCLYLDKHNRLNAHLTRQFFAVTLERQALQYHFLVDDEHIVGFYCFLIVRDVFLVVGLGYDQSVGRKKGLYRQLVISCIQEAKKRGLTLNLSAGVDAFKASRGGQSITEYEAVYFRHLPVRQRLAWRLLQLKCGLSVTLRKASWR